MRKGNSGKLAEIKIGIWIIVVSIGIGSALSLIQWSRNPSRPLTDYMISLVFSLLIAAVGILLRAWYKIQVMQVESTDFRRNIDKYGDELRMAMQRYGHQTIQFRSISEYRWIMRTTTTRILKYHSELIKTDSESCSIDSKNLAVRANIFFWETLRKAQENRPSGSIEVHVTHTAAVEFWDREDAQESLDEQAKFIKINGKVTRIFSGDIAPNDIIAHMNGSKVSSDLRIQTFARIISEMKLANIQVKYLKKIEIPDTLEPEATANSDYLIAKIVRDDGSYEMAMIWGDIQRTSVTNCELLIESHHKFAHYKRRMSVLLSRSVDL